ncbi:MAG TPA: SAM-dependent chlorinase/fluorinase [Syntrophorhabdaceae bacterium]|nr:SAM-dependent chlorinase/fluorinase [Syntrophorhabdaceae bacterium]
MSTITLLSDFGLHDPYVGIMKGVILSINVHVTVVDITHEIEPGDIREAAFVVDDYWRFFPSDSVHVAIVDPTVGSERRPIVVRRDTHCFVGPDNGIFTLIMDGASEVYAIEKNEFMLKKVSGTFHGRDVFAPAAAHLAQGIAPSSAGEVVHDPVRLDLTPRVENNALKGQVVRIDRFGNAITNIKGEFLKDFANGRPFSVTIADLKFTTLNRSYYESQFTCLAGSSGYIEFGYFKGSFAAIKNIKKGETVSVFL